MPPANPPLKDESLDQPVWGHRCGLAPRDRRVRRRRKQPKQSWMGLYPPENLFYSTGAPGTVLCLYAAKPKAREGKLFLFNASQIFEKGDPKKRQIHQ